MRAAFASDNRHWVLAGGLALTAHLAVSGAVGLIGGGAAQPQHEQPVVLIELPPMAAPAPAPFVAEQVRPEQPDYEPPRVLAPRINAPRVDSPLPRELVSAPPPPPSQPPRSNPASDPPPAAGPASPANFAPAGTGAGTGTTPGNSPEAQAEEADYIALVNAHLARRKRYPTEARQARQQGVVTVRFTVSRDGTVSASTVRRSSGHDLLDSATIDLLQRVSPLPRFPRGITRDSLTIVLPIEYSLRTN